MRSNGLLFETVTRGVTMFSSVTTLVLFAMVTTLIWIFGAVALSRWDNRPRLRIMLEGAAVAIVADIVFGGFGWSYNGLEGSIIGEGIVLLLSILLMLAPK
jgi:hypothetical protein